MKLRLSVLCPPLQEWAGLKPFCQLGFPSFCPRSVTDKIRSRPSEINGVFWSLWRNLQSWHGQIRSMTRLFVGNKDFKLGSLTPTSRMVNYINDWHDNVAKVEHILVHVTSAHKNQPGLKKSRQQRLFKGILQVFTETWSRQADLSWVLCDENSINFNTKHPQLLKMIYFQFFFRCTFHSNVGTRSSAGGRLSSTTAIITRNQ